MEALSGAEWHPEGQPVHTGSDMATALALITAAGGTDKPAPRPAFIVDLLKSAGGKSCGF
jgi:hypothetical protein